MGKAWYVHSERETPYGFAVQFGFYGPKTRRCGCGYGPLRVIVTEPLADFLRARESDAIASLGLPLSTSTVWRLRQRLGISEVGAQGKWWEARIGDLKSLRARGFAHKYGVSRAAVFYYRKRLLKG